ncbi:MAG: M50 family metallopeptidase [bacterium]
MITAITFILVFGFIIFIHELGHFLAAKYAKVGVKVFAFGFPPKIWSKKVGETEYKINLIPFGGYVKLEGEDEETEEIETIIVEKKRNSATRGKTNKLFDQNAATLLLIFSAGVVMNLVSAFLILVLLFIVGFKPIELGEFNRNIFPSVDRAGDIKSTVRVVVAEVEKNTPAEKEGIRKGDIIVSVDGKKVYFSDELVSIVRSRITKNGANVNLTIDRDGQTLTKSLTTYKSKIKTSDNQEKEVNRIGIVPETDGTLKGGLFASMKAAFITEVGIAKYTVIGIYDFFSKIFTQFKLSENMVGPIGLVVVTNYFSHLGLEAILQFAVILSVSVALFNILPIPALDGGFIAFTLIEIVTRRKIPLRLKNTINLVGFALLMSLMIIVTFRDFFTFDVWQYILKLVNK